MIKLIVRCPDESAPLANVIAKAVSRTMPQISPVLWTDTFVATHHSLPSLIKAAEGFQLALMMFCPDGPPMSWDPAATARADNILIEAGIFLGRLGPKRVAITIADDVEAPSHPRGLLSARFSSAWTHGKIAKQVARQLTQIWGLIQDPSGLGVEHALRTLETQASTQIESLYFPDPENQRPITIDSRQCLTIYHHGLERVSERFWTTTFLRSPFWTGSEVERTLDVNRDMLERISGCGHGAARRAFLLPSAPEQFLLDQKREVRKLRHAGAVQAIEIMKDEVTRLRDRIRRMSGDGFDTRVLHDAGSLIWNSFIQVFNVAHKNGDTEIAIYDKYRIDLYSGGSRGAIDGVFCLTLSDRDFKGYIAATEDYFHHIWRIGEDANKFMDEYEDAIYVAANEIDHEANWFAKYDYCLSKADEQIKTKEMDKMTQFVKGHFEVESISRYLDIGSCTGRYPLHLLKTGKFGYCPTVLALENDEEALQLIKAKFELPAYQREGSQITAEYGDFMFWDPSTHPSRFDLITCMLGTVSHLAAPGRDGQTKMPLAIEKMAGALAPRGALVLGCWSDAAIRRKDFLAIYTQFDKARLAEWSPTEAEIIDALGRCGLSFQLTHINGRLDLYCCWHAGASL